MDTFESLQFVRERGIYEISKSFVDPIKKVFVPCLNVKDEKVLIIGDVGIENHQISPILAAAYYEAANELNLNVKLVLQEVKTRGSVADLDVIQSLETLQEKNIVVMCCSDKLGSIGTLGKSLRKYCIKKKLRFFSSMSLGDLSNDSVGYVVDAIDIDYKPLQMRQKVVKDILDNGNLVVIKTKAGTDLSIDISGMTAISADGNYSIDGSGGNMPAGEVYIPPNGKGVNGKVVIDGSSRNHKHTSIIINPITLTIKEGSIESIEGKEEAELLRETIKWAQGLSKHPGSLKRICEFGIGMNPKAKIIGSTLVDEKSLGTAHIGIGSNYWFGGSIYSILHLDQVFKDPEIYVDGKKLVI
ncbi:MAG: aminopeptidase [Nanoarchaeota archaeon]|nr:aminopeptidase [Nanoarchaeota archaeon]MBU1704998.1 aminopeptidase [Nanoarchaeota archaeon]